MSARAFHLRDAQKNALSRVLSLQQEKLSPWKVLVVDAEAADVVSCIFPASDLRRFGVTLTLPIDSSRAPLSDIPAVYVVSPTSENVARLLRDLDGIGNLKGKNARLYPAASLAFTSPASLKLLKNLASTMKLPARISSVHDLYADFLSLEQRLFSLNIPKSYVVLNTPDEAAQSALVDRVVSGLFSVLASLGVVPVIRSQRGGASEAVARALDKRLRENINSFRGSTIGGGGMGRSSFRRPLLLLLDRDVDLTAMLHHTWTYQALVHDCLRQRLNAVSLPAAEGGAKSYELHKESDPFWRENARKPFPSVAESIEAALNRYRSDVQAVNEKAGGDTTANGTTHQLASAISSLPELSRRKEAIDVHANIATALLSQIKARALDAFFQFETRTLAYASGSPPTRTDALALKEPLMSLVRGEGASAGTPADRLRAAVIYYTVFGSAMSTADVDELSAALTQSGADASVLQRVAELNGFVSNEVEEVPDGSRRAKLRGMMSSALNRGIKAVSRLPSTLIGESARAFAVARVLRLFLSDRARANDAGADEILDRYLYFDPKVDVDGESGGFELDGRMRNMVFSDAIVFVTGGGNYVEYGNCVECVEEDLAGERRVVYGATEIVDAGGFLNQVGLVARTDVRAPPRNSA